MKLLLIRHSLALDISEFRGHDFDRPLSHRGVKRAFRFFKVLKHVYPSVDYIVTSPAVRAKQTAEVMKKFYDAKLIEEPKLYPGATPEDFEEVLKKYEGTVAVVGHEPDLSSFIKYICLSPNLNIKLSKPSLVEIEGDVLKALFQYKQIKAIYENAFKDS